MSMYSESKLVEDHETSEPKLHYVCMVEHTWQIYFEESEPHMQPSLSIVFLDVAAHRTPQIKP